MSESFLCKLYFNSPITVLDYKVSSPPFFLRDSRASETHAHSRFARSTIPQEKWGTTRSLPITLLSQYIQIIWINYNHIGLVTFLSKVLYLKQQYTNLTDMIKYLQKNFNLHNIINKCLQCLWSNFLLQVYFSLRSEENA